MDKKQDPYKVQLADITNEVGGNMTIQYSGFYAHEGATPGHEEEWSQNGCDELYFCSTDHEWHE